jgi:hypothetical protein
MDNKYTLKEILMTSAFRRITNTSAAPRDLYDTGGPAPDLSGFDAKYVWVPQSEFLRELYPQGHRILDPSYYKNDWIQVKEDLPDGRSVKHWVEREVARCVVPFQYVIKTQQLIHVQRMRGEIGADLNILAHGEIRHEVIRLKDIAEVLAAIARECAVAQGVERLPVEQDRAAVRRFDAADDIE